MDVASKKSQSRKQQVMQGVYYNQQSKNSPYLIMKVDLMG